MDQDRIPICNCEAWWEQGWCGRQPMENLQLSFTSGNIRGSGTDLIGPFVFAGIISAGGAVAMCKQYIGQHSVDYVGEYTGEGVMSGEWRLGELRGRWMIALRRLATGAVADIEEIGPTG